MKRLFLKTPARAVTTTKILLSSSMSEVIESIDTLSSFDRIVFLYDARLENSAAAIQKSLPSALLIPVSGGEHSKSLSEVERIASIMLRGGCTKNTLLIACGGGMLTDLGGFVASVFMRGIQSMLIPTTLLGMVDAAIGGKNAVNCGGRKNMIGITHHPMSVIIDLSFLSTLPDAQFSDGMAEVIKIAAITDASFFAWLEESFPKILAREKGAVQECIERAIAAKIRIVEQDDLDQDCRLWLNFGHTVGHAVEALSGYRLSHGQAISIGMMAELRMSSSKDLQRFSALLEAFNLPTKIPETMSEEELYTLMASDKKSIGGTIRIAVPRSMGEGSILPVSREQFHSIFS